MCVKSISLGSLPFSEGNWKSGGSRGRGMVDVAGVELEGAEEVEAVVRTYCVKEE